RKLSEAYCQDQISPSALFKPGPSPPNEPFPLLRMRSPPTAPGSDRLHRPWLMVKHEKKSCEMRPDLGAALACPSFAVRPYQLVGVIEGDQTVPATQPARSAEPSNPQEVEQFRRPQAW